MSSFDDSDRGAGRGRSKAEKKPSQSSEFDLAAGLALQDAGIELVSQNSGDFIPDALLAIARLKKFVGPSEDIREYLEGKGIVPHDTHAWGALTKNLIRIGWFRPTGDRVRMRSVKSNGRDTAVYELCLDGSPPPTQTPRPSMPRPVAWDAELQQLTEDFAREFPEMATMIGGPKDGIWYCWFRRFDGAKGPLPPKSQADSLVAALLAGYATARKWKYLMASRGATTDA